MFKNKPVYNTYTLLKPVYRAWSLSVWILNRMLLVNQQCDIVRPGEMLESVGQGHMRLKSGGLCWPSGVVLLSRLPGRAAPDDN